VTLAPQIRLAERELTLPPGPLAENVEVDPAMSRGAMMYVLPALASVTRAQGAFSVQLDACRISLADPAKSDVSGRVIVHSVEVGPGPLMQQLSQLLASRPTMTPIKRESTVTFRMVNGRVYHQGLELEFPELTVRTYGSVGLDQSLALMTEMSVPPKWLAGVPISDALKNQTVRIPIGGTLDRPKIDEREIARVSAEMLRNVGGTIRNEVSRQLDHLFGPVK
jgi:hypothetical protein